jgi:hypothetical protein
MAEEAFRGDEIESIVTEASGVNEYNSIRWWWNGNEINARDLELVIYNDKEED